MTSFRDAKFENANFHRANFKKDCDFKDAEFVKQASFKDSTFTASVGFDRAKFRGVTSFDLAAATSVAAPLSFQDAEFFKHPPRFFGRALHEDTDWTGVKLPDAEAQAALPRYLLEDDKRAYEQLRIKCGALGKVEDEHMFFRREMELTGRLSPWYTRATYWLYHLVSDYGHSYWRPIAGMGGYGSCGAYFTRFISWPETSCIGAWTGSSFSSASRACLLRIFLPSLGFIGGFPVIFWPIPRL